MALPKEPRQKMINMMYLVLTAMLAINVSAEILNAFKTVDHSINRSNELIASKDALDMKAFAQAEKDQDPAKVLPFKINALQAALLSARACDYIDTLKKEVKMNSHGSIVPPSQEFPDGIKFADDNMDGPTRVMDNQKKGNALKDSLESYREAFLNLLPSNLTAAQKAEFTQTLSLKIEIPHVENKGNTDWVGAHFRMVPAIAAITILDKFKNDIKSSANAIIEDNLKQINALDIKFDQFKPFISANSSYLMNGQQYTATIGVGAYSSAVHPQITVDGVPVKMDGSLGTFTETASGAGQHTHHITIRVPKPDGTYMELTQPIEYNVGSSTFAVSSDLTKVVFRGINNPISVSGGGVGAEDLGVSASSGSLVKTGPGKYDLKPGDPNEDKISVTAHRPDGTSASLGSESFIVKDIPNPVAWVGSNPGGRMRAAEFRVNGGLRAVLENFDFLSGVQFQVTSFTVYAVGGDFPTMQQGQSSSYSFAQVQNIISKCKPGTIVSFEDIHAIGPDKRTRKLRGVTFELY
jgi:gliding motility-associated protein GldM